MTILLLGLLILKTVREKEQLDIQHSTTFDPQTEEINTFLQDKIRTKEDVLAYLVYDVQIDHIDFDNEKKLALIWLSLMDPDSGLVIPAEAGLAIGIKNTDPSSEETWKIFLQSDTEWLQVLADVPLDLLDQETKDLYTTSQQKQAHTHLVLDGYRLPWEAGEMRHLTGSIGHVFTYKTCPETCLYAFDFADGSNFPIVAAKSGVVKYYAWQYPDGNTKHANFIVLEDTSTTPTTYQVYTHLSQGSIPEELRRVGAKVVQGQFIGRVDDTGVSTGSHLHFHVHTNPTSYWGNSVDITFDDVAINGGRPRTCLEAAMYPEYGNKCQSENAFVSGNGDSELPTGGISSPKNGDVITTQSFTLNGWAKDDMEIASVMVKFTRDGNWEYLNFQTDQTSFSLNIDLCDMDVPDGKFFIALEIFDKAGKQTEGLPGLTQLDKAFTCPLPPPQCSANDNQIAVFENADYQGSCQVINVGESLNYSLQYGQIGSIQIGGNVYASFFSNQTQEEDLFYLLNSKMDLSSEQSDLTNYSSVTTKIKPSAPSQPLINIPAKEDGLPLDHLDDITLQWAGNESLKFFRSEVTETTGIYSNSLDWTKDISWHLGSLPVGEYTWTVWGKNVMGENSTTIRFSVNKADLPPETEMTPNYEMLYTTMIPLHWQVLDNSDDIQLFQIQVRESGSEWQDFNNAIDGELRRINFYGEFGKTYEFRLRAVDMAGNVESYPSEPEVSYTLETYCNPDDYDYEMADNSQNTATPIEFEELQIHNLCGLQDSDWMQFVGTEGEIYQIVINGLDVETRTSLAVVTANNPHSSDVIFMEDNENKLVYKITAEETGVIYLRLASENPLFAGTNSRYSVSIEQTDKVFVAGPLVTLLLVPMMWAFIKFRHLLKTSKK